MSFYNVWSCLFYYMILWRAQITSELRLSPIFYKNFEQNMDIHGLSLFFLIKKVNFHGFAGVIFKILIIFNQLKLECLLIESEFSRKKSLSDLWCWVLGLFGQFFPWFVWLYLTMKKNFDFHDLAWLFSVLLSKTWPSIVKKVIVCEILRVSV